MPAANSAKAQAYMQKANDNPDVYCFTLNRPDARNALSKWGLNNLDEAVAFDLSSPL